MIDLELEQFQTISVLDCYTHMIRQLFLLALIANAIPTYSQSLQEVRQGFHDVVFEPKLTKQFHSQLAESENSTPELQAYRAVSEAMMARVVWNPVSKLAQVIKYAGMMEEVVEANPDNIEVRFLRLSIEYNIPRFLGMSKHLDEDANMIISNLSDVASMNIDPTYGRYILDFLIKTDLCSYQQLRVMKSRFQQVTLEMQ